mmetsp:Transcript_16400/g.24583  ORF Transcript_16400/g.24583 Transcript_16400/m.24583 type:complete len:138 (-) Transcript_16400:39-452(-)
MRLDLSSLWICHGLKFDRLTIGKGAEALYVDGSLMDEYITFTVIGYDESVTFFCVEPFNYSSSTGGFFFSGHEECTGTGSGGSARGVGDGKGRGCGCHDGDSEVEKRGAHDGCILLYVLYGVVLWRMELLYYELFRI